MPPTPLLQDSVRFWVDHPEEKAYHQAGTGVGGC